jgi:hypothetical protein
VLSVDDLYAFIHPIVSYSKDQKEASKKFNARFPNGVKVEG